MYELVIGLEIHIKIKSATKLFCQCQNIQNFDTLLPNTHICPTCMGQPGALPVLQQEALEKSLLLGRALGCEIADISRFDRKSYFYPDLPMGYQITQVYLPTNINGEVSFFLNQYQDDRKVSIRQAHMETDTAKMIHESGQALIDFNRAGTPLVEIVTGPDFSSADEVVEFLKELQRIVRYNNISDADMEKGQMRVDVNISIRKAGDALGIRTETKNLNSFTAIRNAIAYEYQRQQEVLDAGGVIDQETRGRNDQEGQSFVMRSKADALDYRYFPEPDLPPLQVSEETIADVQSYDLEIPYAIIKICKEDYGFHKEYINALISDKTVLDYFLQTVEEGHDPKLVAKWIAGPIAAYMKENYVAIDALSFDRKQFTQFITTASKGDIMDNQLKIVMEEMLQTGDNLDDIITAKGFDTPAIDTKELEHIIQQIMIDNPSVVQQYREGKTSTIGFFVGQVMKATQGKANPKDVQTSIKHALENA